jgi:hypothetical protein
MTPEKCIALIRAQVHSAKSILDACRALGEIERLLDEYDESDSSAQGNVGTETRTVILLGPPKAPDAKDQL